MKFQKSFLSEFLCHIGYQYAKCLSEFLRHIGYQHAKCLSEFLRHIGYQYAKCQLDPSCGLNYALIDQFSILTPLSPFHRTLTGPNCEFENHFRFILITRTKFHKNQSSRLGRV